LHVSEKEALAGLQNILWPPRKDIKVRDPEVLVTPLLAIV